MGWIASVRCQKFGCEFVARTFALIAPVHPISHEVSCSNETIQNAPKHYKTHQFMSFASNGEDRVRSLRKTLKQFRGTNFFINCTSSTHFAPSFVQQRNKSKMHPNSTKETNTWFRVQWGGSSAFFAKNSDATLWQNLCINCTSSPHFAPSFMY